MREEDGNIIMPGTFINVAEIFGMIGSIDRIVAEKTMVKQAALSKEGKCITFSINLSGKDLGDEKLLSFLQEKIVETGADPSHLVFEITETEAIHDLRHAVQFITELKSIGCQFSLDDFGVGFTSFIYLKEMLVDFIKIDGSFIKNLSSNKDDQVVVKSIIGVAKGMGVKTVAEFVETQESLDLLKEWGIDYAQGYLIGKPEPDPKF
jgi:EAL domain-containing protein (putative c-di-GMP-specific phosphodiesterase class I)